MLSASLAVLLSFSAPAFAQESGLKIAVAGMVGRGESAAMAPKLSDLLTERLASARVPNVRFVRPAPGTTLDGQGASLAKVREFGRALGVDKVVIGMVLYAFSKPAPPAPRVRTVQKVQTQWVDAEYTEETANPEYREWQDDPMRNAAGSAAASACGRGIEAFFCGAAATMLVDGLAAPPATIKRTVKTKLPKTTVTTEQVEEPVEEPDQDKILRLRVMYVIVDVNSGAVDHKDLVDYTDKVPEMFESLDTDHERKNKAIEKALPAVQDSIVRAAPRLRPRPKT